MRKPLNPFANFSADIPASIVVFLVAMPLCLGIAMASGAPLYSGIISGIIGGIIVGSISGSSIGVSGPAAGLAVIVLTAINDLGAFDIFLVAVILAGIIQVIMGYLRAGIIGYYFPSSVIHGMLAGIGILIFLKQIPHAFGYDADYEGDFEFQQPDGHNTFSELIYTLDNFTPGAVIVTATSLFILLLWESNFMQKQKFSKVVPGPLVAVVSGIILNILFASSEQLAISEQHLVNIPVAANASEFLSNFTFPNFAGLSNPQVYVSAIIIAVIASLETLLSLEAADKLDSYKRISPANRELKAQGIGNIVAGLIGGIPVTQVIVRSSANAQSGGKTKASTVLHGIWLLLSIIFIPNLLNKIPLATLAAILLLVGYKLAKPSLFIKMYKQGMEQFAPFLVTIVVMLLSDLLVGIGFGLVIAIFIILKNNLQVPFTILKTQLKDKQNIKIVLSEDVTFLNKAAIQNTLAAITDNSKVTIDASNTKFLHFDVIEILDNFEINAESRNIQVSRIGFDGINEKITPQHFEMEFEDPISKEKLDQLTPEKALDMLKEGNLRFMENHKLHRDYQTQIDQTKFGQYPFGVVLSCIDSRVPVELVFDQGIGDLFSIRVAGNIINGDVLGSMEYGCKVVGSKIIVVLGHTSCGAVNAACAGFELDNITPMLHKIKPAIKKVRQNSPGEELSSDQVSIENVKNSMAEIRSQSPILAELEKNGQIKIVGANYSVDTGQISFFE